MQDDSDAIEQQRNHFESISNDYNAARDNPRTLAVNDSIWSDASRIIQRYRKEEGEGPVILDAMCGIGSAWDAMNKYLGHNFVYEAFDYAPSMVEAIKRRLPGVNAWEQDITLFDAKERYDIIAVYAALHHVHLHIDKVVGNIYAALKPGGTFITYEPTHGNWVFKKIREAIYRNMDAFDEETERDFGVDELVHIAGNHGFRNILKTHPGLLSHVLWAVPGVFPFLNKGSERLVKTVLSLEKPFRKTKLARLLSFSTLYAFTKE